MITSILLYLALFFNAPANQPEEQVCLSAEEIKLYELINDYRKSKKLAPVPYSAKLSLVAQTHARDLVNNYDFNPNARCNPHSWSKEGNWSSCCYTNDHKAAQCMWDKPKEIAGYESSGYEIAFYASSGAKAEQGLAGWKKSSGHNPLLINSGIWKDVTWGGIGIGIYKEYAVVWFGELKDSDSKIVPCN